MRALQPDAGFASPGDFGFERDHNSVAAACAAASGRFFAESPEAVEIWRAPFEIHDGGSIVDRLMEMEHNWAWETAVRAFTVGRCAPQSPEPAYRFQFSSRGQTLDASFVTGCSAVVL